MERRAPEGESDRRAPGRWAEGVVVLLVLACVGGSLGLVIAMHRRHAADGRRPAAAVAVARPLPAPPPPAPGPKREPKPRPAPEPVEDPTPKALAALAAREAEERAAAASADREAASLESARKAALASSATDRRREALARARLKALEDKVRRLEDEADALARERDALAAEREATRADLELARIRAGAPNSFAILPYKGTNGTWRRPIPIECRDGTATLMPNGPTYSLIDLSGDPRGNPLVSAILMAGARLRRQESPDGAPIEPYVLFIVRPDGIRPFYEARVRIEALGIPFGYELADTDWSIDYPDIGDPATWVDAAAPPGIDRGEASPFPGGRGVGDGPSRGGASPFPGGRGAEDRLTRGPRPGEIAESVRGATAGWGGFPTGALDRGGRYINGVPRPGAATAGGGTREGVAPGRSSGPAWGPGTPGNLPGPAFRELEAMAGDGPAGGRGRGGSPTAERSGRAAGGWSAAEGAGRASGAAGGGDWAVDGRRPGGAGVSGGSAEKMGNGLPGDGGRVAALPGASGQPAGGQAGGMANPPGQTAGGQGGNNSSTAIQPGGSPAQGQPGGNPFDRVAQNGPGGQGRPPMLGTNPPADGRGQAGAGEALGRLRPVPPPDDEEPKAPGGRGGGAGGQAGEGGFASGSGVRMERRPVEPLELVVACGPDGLTIQPGNYRLKAAELNARGDPLPRLLRGIANRRQSAAPALSIRPEVKFLVEPGGQESYWSARRQTILAGLGWPMSFKVVEGSPLRLLAEESR